MVQLIKNATVVSGKGMTIRDVWTRDGRFCLPQPKADTITDAQGSFLLPGFIDLHTHGAAGVYYPDGVDFAPALEHCGKLGITTLLPTLGARPLEEMVKSMEHILRQQKLCHPGAKIGGIHLEGPFISQSKKGAMEPPELACTPEHFEALLEAGGGMVRVMTIAPERENACEVIRKGRDLGIRMSLGHTDATYAQACAAIDAGATGATHTFNAMGSYHHREPGILGAVLTDPRISCEVICDMVHLAPATVQLIRHCKGTEGMILISDCGMFAGVEDGAYICRGQAEYVQGGVARLTDDTISSSCCTIYEAAKKLLELGFSLCDIAAIGAENPAKAIGMQNTIGSLDIGKDADFMICDEALEIHHVYIKGDRYV